MLLAVLPLVVLPSHLCALIETGHSHSSEGASASTHVHSHSHQAVADYHGGHQHAGDTPHAGSRFSLGTPWDADNCCSDVETPPMVVAAQFRSIAPDASSASVLFAPATLPVAQAIFSLTNCHGRDGRPDHPLRSQFVPFSLLGRAPPAAV